VGSGRSHSGYGFLLVLDVGASPSNLGAIDRLDADWSGRLLRLRATAQQSWQSEVEFSSEIDQKERLICVVSSTNWSHHTVSCQSAVTSTRNVVGP